MKKKTRSMFLKSWVGLASVLVITGTGLVVSYAKGAQEHSTSNSTSSILCSNEGGHQPTNSPNATEKYLDVQDGIVKRFTPGFKIPQNFDLVVRTQTTQGKAWKIEKDAFKDKREIRSVLIEDGIEIIDQSAFEGCINLETISLPKSLVEIGSSAFNHCAKLEKVIIPNNVTKIGESAFRNCQNLKSVSIPHNVNSIGWKIFDGCNKLTSENVQNFSSVLFDWWVNKHIYGGQKLDQKITIDLANYTNSENQPFRKIADRAFANCQILNKIIIPEGVNEIGNRTFKRCKNLKSVVLPESLNFIGNAIFENCSGLKVNEVINNSPVLFDWWVNNHLYDKKSLSQMRVIVLNSYLNSKNQPFRFVAPRAFNNCSKVNEIILSEVKSIGNFAFCQCLNLKTVMIPKSVEFIGKRVFDDCHKLNHGGLINNSTILFDWWFVNHQYNKQPLQKMDCIDLTNYENSLLQPFQTISDEAIVYSPNHQPLVELVLPETIKKIGSSNFATAEKLKKLTVLGSNLVYDYKLINSLNKQVNFRVVSPDLKNDLVKWGIEQNRLSFVDKSDHFFVASNQELIGLTLAGRQQKKLTVPMEVKFITRASFNRCSQQLENITLKGYNILFEKNFFTNIPSNVKYYVNNNRLSVRLQNAGIKPSQIHVADGDWLVKTNVENGQVIGLTNYGQTKEQLVIPATVKSLDQNTFNKHNINLKMVIFEGDQITLNGKVFENLNKTTKYCVNNETIARELNKAGINSANIGIDRGNFFVSADGSKRILHLTKRGQATNHLVISENINKIDDRAFSECHQLLKLIELQNPNISFIGNPFINVPKTTSYLVNSYAVGQNLKQLQIDENQITVQANDLVHVGVSHHLELTGLTNAGSKNKTNLIIPANVISIGPNALAKCHPELTKITIEGDDLWLHEHAFKDVSPTLEYYVNNQLMKTRLQSRGINAHKINVAEGDWLVKMYDQQIELVGLTRVGKEKTKLVVPAATTKLGDDLFEGCSPNLESVMIRNNDIDFSPTALKSLPNHTKFKIFSKVLKHTLSDLNVHENRISLVETELKPNSKQTKSTRKVMIITGSVLGGLAILSLGVGVSFYICKRR